MNKLQRDHSRTPEKQGLHEKKKAKRSKNKKSNIFKRIFCAGLSLVIVYCLFGKKGDKKSDRIPEPAIFEEQLDDLDLDTITKTDDYALIRIDGKTYLTKSTKIQNEQQVITKYYEVETKSFVGQTIDVAWYNRAYNTETEDDTPTSIVTINNDLQDYLEFNGEYGYKKNLPKEAVLPLTALVDLETPGEALYEYYAKDSTKRTETIEEKYQYKPLETIDYTDFIFTNKHRFFGDTYKDSYEMEVFKEEKPLMQIVYVDSFDKEQTIIGYRASTNSCDVGYNVFYDIITGKIYKLDQLRIKMLATIRKDNYTISELKDLFYKTEVEELSLELEEQTPAPLEIKNIEHPDAMYTKDEIVVLDTEAESINNLQGNPNKYLFLGLSGLTDNVYVYQDLFNSGIAFITNDLTMGTYQNFHSGVYISSTSSSIENDTIIYKHNGLQSINSFLENNGYAKYSKEKYTYEDLEEIIALLGYQEKTDASEIVVIDTKSTSLEISGNHERYLFLKYKEHHSNLGLTYYLDMNNPNAIVQIEENGQLLYANGENTCFFKDISLPIPYWSINDFLKNQNMEDRSKTSYTWGEIMQIQLEANKSEMVLERS